MTQAQFAQWLGVSIKQVKYLEHQRRNPSGPSRRLLDILSLELRFDGVPAVQVLGASQPQPKLLASKPKPRTAPVKSDDDGNIAPPPVPTLSAETAPTDLTSPVTAPPDDDAFVWR